MFSRSQLCACAATRWADLWGARRWPGQGSSGLPRRSRAHSRWALQSAGSSARGHATARLSGSGSARCPAHVVGHLTSVLWPGSGLMGGFSGLSGTKDGIQRSLPRPIRAVLFHASVDCLQARQRPRVHGEAPWSIARGPDKFLSCTRHDMPLAGCGDCFGPSAVAGPICLKQLVALPNSPMAGMCEKSRYAERRRADPLPGRLLALTILKRAG